MASSSADTLNNTFSLRYRNSSNMLCTYFNSIPRTFLLEIATFDYFILPMKKFSSIYSIISVVLFIKSMSNVFYMKKIDNIRLQRPIFYILSAFMSSYCPICIERSLYLKLLASGVSQTWTFAQNPSIMTSMILWFSLWNSSSVWVIKSIKKLI